MDKEERMNLDDIFNFGEEEIEEDQVDENMEEILEKNIEERDKSNINDKEIISEFNKNNLSSPEKTGDIITQLDLVEQSLLENQNNKTAKEIEKEQKEKEEKEKNNIDNAKSGKNKIKINKNEFIIKLPEEFNDNPTPYDFIDFMERKYNKYALEKDRSKYFYLETYVKERKFPDIKCYKFEQKNTIMNHILKTENNYSRYNKSQNKITCLVSHNDLIYVGDNNGLIKIFSINSEIEIGPLNPKADDIINPQGESENMSVTSMDILPKKNLLACGFYNGDVEIWDIKNKICKKKLTTNLTQHKGHILAVKFLNGNAKMMEVITSDSSGLVNTTSLTEKLFTFKRNAELNAEVVHLIDYLQPIYVVEILKFTEEEKTMPFLKNKVEIVGFACYDYVLIYQINPDLVELYKFTRPPYFTDFHIANISFGLGYLPRTKNIIDINYDQNQRLNPKASEFCLDSKNTNRLVAVSWDTFINIYAIKYDREKGVESISIVGNYIHSCQIKRMLFLEDSTIFIYDKKGKFKLLNTGFMTPDEINFGDDPPTYDEKNEKRALIQDIINVTDKVLKQNYIPQTTKNDNKITTETYYNSIYANENNIYILGQNDLQFGKIYTWDEIVTKLKNDFDWINALIFGLKLFKGERIFIPFSGVPIDNKKRKQKIGEKMREILKEYVQERFKLDKGQINEAKYTKILTECVFLSLEFCFAIESCDFLFKELLPIYTKKNLEKFFFENLEPYIINGDFGNQIFEENIIKRLVIIYSDRKEYQKLGQIIKNLYLSVGNSETVGNRVTKYDTIFTGLITYYSSDKNEDYMFPARQIYSYFQSAKDIPYELYLKEKMDEKTEKKIFYFDYENIINNIDIDDLILSYQYLGSLLLWYIQLCYEGYKFPSGKSIDDKKYEELIQQLFLWLINDEILQRFLEFDCYNIFVIFKKFLMKKTKILEKIEYSDLFKLIKLNGKELNEANVQKYFEIIYKKVLYNEKIKNIYILDDLYDFICSVATIIPLPANKTTNNNYILLEALQYVINYEDNIRTIQKFEQDLLNKKIDNYKQNLELKEKYDRYCMHLLKYKDKTFFLNLSNIIMAAIDNNMENFSTKDLENLLYKTEKTNLTKVKVYLAKKLGNFGKCLDVYLKEFKGEEQIFLIYNFIHGELNKYDDDKIMYQKIKDEILSRITEIAALNIDKVIELTEKYYNSNYAEILFKINNNENKLKYLESILSNYNEDEMNPNEPKTLEYQKILRLQIDLLCKLKYYEQILPNLQKRNFYPIEYCLEKCQEFKIYDASIYLLRKSGNISEAINIVNLLNKENFLKLSEFYSENFEIIKKYDTEEDMADIEYINELIEAEEESKNLQRSKEDEILYQKKGINYKRNKILKLGIDICESASQMMSKEESKKIWQSLISVYYELIHQVNSNISINKISPDLGKILLKILEENNIGEIIEEMNSYFDLNSVLMLISQIQGKSFTAKEYKSLLKRLVFSGESFNRILNVANSILQNNILDSKKEYKTTLLLGQEYDYETCDYCKKLFNEKDKNGIFFFNCGHKSHYDCSVFINGDISCKSCFDFDNDNNETMLRKEMDIKYPKEEGRDKRSNTLYKKPSATNLKNKTDIDKEKRFKILNEINDSYFEFSKIFDKEIN